jgi:hypothetical protein
MMHGNPDLYALWRDATANGYFRWGDAESFQMLAARNTSLAAAWTRPPLPNRLEKPLAW